MTIRVIIWKPLSFLFARLSWDILLQLFNNHFILILFFVTKGKEALKWENKKSREPFYSVLESVAIVQNS